MERYSIEKYEEDKRIIDYVETNGISIDNPYHDIPRKIDFLKRICGYTSLRVGSDLDAQPFLLIEECDSERISVVVRKIYWEAKDRTYRYSELVKRDGFSGDNERGNAEENQDASPGNTLEGKVDKIKRPLELNLGFHQTRHGDYFVGKDK